MLTPARPCTRGFRIVAETNGTVLMGHAGELDSLADIKIAGKQSLVTLMAVHRTGSVPQCFLQVGLQPAVSFAVVGRVAENNLALAVDGDAIVGIGQIFRSQPKIQRML